MKYVAPIKIDGYSKESWFTDAKGIVLGDRDIARDLTEFYAMKARQEECGKLEGCHDDGYWYTADDGLSDHWEEHSHCQKCGADLTKGANHG